MNSAQIIKGEPWADYTKSHALGSSALSDWGTMSLAEWSARHLEADNPYRDEPGKPGDAKNGGSYLDALLTGNKPESEFAIRPDSLDSRTKEGKAWIVENAGKTLLSADQAKQVKAALPFAREAADVLRASDAIDWQVTLRGEIDGVKVQTRPDLWIETDRCIRIPDLKYVSQIDKFDRQLFGGRYEIQAALAYELARLAGVEKRIEIYFLLVESGTMNPRCWIDRIPSNVVERFVERLHTRCQSIASARDDGRGFVDQVEVRECELPGWAMRELGL